MHYVVLQYHYILIYCDSSTHGSMDTLASESQAVGSVLTTIPGGNAYTSHLAY